MAQPTFTSLTVADAGHGSATVAQMCPIGRRLSSGRALVPADRLTRRPAGQSDLADRPTRRRSLILHSSCLPGRAVPASRRVGLTARTTDRRSSHMRFQMLNYFLSAAEYVKARLTPEDGATAVEYGLIVALIAAVIITVVLVLGKQVYNAFCTVVTNLGNGGSCTAKTPGAG
jgi:pilus assembly protein Flp/PilA